mmetsp:Transcript_11730/g.18804  ORF Transcript_11730/g.18804 Transcript_11730/m.18804 type:complete len:182 (-) Transcript_11730:509-1054(-)
MGCQGSCFPNILGMDPLQTLSAYNNGVYQRMSPPPFQRRGRVKISLREKKESSVHWVRYTNEDGIPYYFDTTTGTSQWTQPSSPVVVGNSVGRIEKSLREVFNESQEDLRDRMQDTEWVRFVDESTKVEYFKNIRTGKVISCTSKTVALGKIFGANDENVGISSLTSLTPILHRPHNLGKT